MSYTPISRHGVDSAEPLDFPTAAPAFPRIVLRTVVEYDGFTFQVEFNDTSIGDAVAVLKKRGCVPAKGKEHAAPAAMPQADVPPTCPVHNRSMKAMKFADKHGHTWMCTSKVGDDWCSERA